MGPPVLFISVLLVRLTFPHISSPDSLILLGISFIMGRHFDEIIRSGEIVGANEDEEGNGQIR